MSDCHTGYIDGGNSMEYRDILFEISDNVATIKLNRPEVGNAWSKDTPTEVMDAISCCADNDEVRAIVITGSGKHFCAGGDINRFKRLIDTKQYLEIPSILRAGEMGKAIRRCLKPVIAMINGAAAGAGCSIAMACDFRVMTPSSKLVMAFINVGLSGDTGGLYYLQKLVGTAIAGDLMMRGRPVTGEQAEKYGLVNVLAEEGKLEESTYAFANKMANAPTFALARQKDLINRFFYTDLDAYTELEAKYMQECSETKDFEEAVNSFLEKRTPVFQGK